MDASTFIHADESSNYTRQTTAAITGEVLAPDADFLVYTADHPFAASPAVAVKKNGSTITTGFTASNAAGTITFDPVGVIGEALADSGDHTSYTFANIPNVTGRKIYKNAVEVTTGFTVTDDTITFDSANLEADAITADYTYNPNTEDDEITANYTYTLAQPFLKSTNGTANATVVTNAVTIEGANYAVLKTSDTGVVTYYISRDGGTTYYQILPNHGKFIGIQPTGTSIVLKMVLAPTATVKKFGLSFR
jgi:hypothetical protein